MSLLRNSAVPAEVTGHDLLAEFTAATDSYRAQLREIASDARDRSTTVEARLQELEAEKLVLNQLSKEPTVFTGGTTTGRLDVTKPNLSNLPVDAPQA